MTTPIQSVVVVGGGTAGWITAARIAARHNTRAGGVRVTLIESPTIPSIGVGEGTWPTMRNTLRKIGIGETQFIRECDAAFKQGAKFARWVTGEAHDFYYHPLMLPQGFTKIGLAPYWHRDSRGRSFLMSGSIVPGDRKFVGSAGLNAALRVSSVLKFTSPVCTNPSPLVSAHG